jgi:glutamine synthetase
MAKTIVEYVWIGGDYELRSKARVIDGKINLVSDLSHWNFDGSSTNQAVRELSEVVIQPVALFNDPFRKSHHKIVLCDTYKPTGEAAKNNNRQWAKTIFDQKREEKPWFGLEQEYFLMDPKTGKPLGFPSDESINNDSDVVVTTDVNVDDSEKSDKQIIKKGQGQYYCSVGTDNAFGRTIIDEHLEACVYAGVTISGVNAEVAPGQWEFQIGPCVGIDEGDHMWMARYLLNRVAEKHGMNIDLEPKPVKGEWNGSGCHANYSTLNMRRGTKNKTGLDYINEAIEKLREKHSEHMAVYGEGNEERMTGEHETASFDVFSDADIDRGCSIRRGSETIKNKKGYFEDRRPSSNCDPYLVTGKIYETTIL